MNIHQIDVETRLKEQKLLHGHIWNVLKDDWRQASFWFTAKTHGFFTCEIRFLHQIAQMPMLLMAKSHHQKVNLGRWTAYLFTTKILCSNMTPLATVLLLTLPCLDYHKCFLVMFIDVYICIYIYTHIIHILYTYNTHIIYIYLDHLVVFCLVCPNITVGVGGLHDADPLYGSSVFHEVGRPLKLAWLGLFKKNGGYIYIY